MDSNTSPHIYLKESKKKILYSIGLVAILFIFKLFGGIFANSLALLSDSLHLITDFFALIISWIGLKLSSKPANAKYTYGHYRHSILTALINNILLICISIFILYKAYLRFLNPVAVESSLMIIFSLLGIIVNTLILLNLKSNANNINVKSALLHFAGDAVADISVLVGAVVIYFSKISIIDTILSLILSLIILRSAVKMTIDCIKIFLEASPKDISLEDLKSTLKGLENVIDVKDLHLWSLSQEVIVMTAHISTTLKDPFQREDLIHQIQHLLKEKFNISHSTIQLESSPCSSCFHSKADHKEKCSLCIDANKHHC
ncbi:MAG: cation transporter [Clostridiales bacterium]|uniref:cation diffusion facilitator family transporter n=1 Tax=Clostridium sp. N3C TaxID=1776758 RepID=UPI00092E1991|nr:cation diffusion facilitator family transporter [Clostridium sp. N3C]NLZ48621.1 cation transporter [Clostridiales bacterium]SCN23542.1 Cadmium, cobalt and zinc/H(+)-K(+) antiporter [Clostridium sp. N3C]